MICGDGQKPQLWAARPDFANRIRNLCGLRSQSRCRLSSQSLTCGGIDELAREWRSPRGCRSDGLESVARILQYRVLMAHCHQKESGIVRRLARFISGALVLLSLIVAGVAEAAPHPPAETEICNPSADYFLGAEDYRAAVRSHLDVLAHEPDNALAHYHLGFAYGMLGQHGDEMREYEKAAAMGLRVFDLFLNLGLARFESGDLTGATKALVMARDLTNRPEPHFDLGLVYERRGMLREAEAELLQAVAAEPYRSDYLNMLAVVAAEQGDIGRARKIWTSIVSRDPQDREAAQNLEVLETAQRAGTGHIAGGGFPIAEASAR